MLVLSILETKVLKEELQHSFHSKYSTVPYCRAYKYVLNTSIGATANEQINPDKTPLATKLKAFFDRS
jgi:hypothetical protein